MTVSCGNVFEDLGFAPDEAAAMQGSHISGQTPMLNGVGANNSFKPTPLRGAA